MDRLCIEVRRGVSGVKLEVSIMMAFEKVEEGAYGGRPLGVLVDGSCSGTEAARNMKAAVRKYGIARLLSEPDLFYRRLSDYRQPPWSPWS